jgi:hypothetical protein
MRDTSKSPLNFSGGQSLVNSDVVQLNDQVDPVGLPILLTPRMEDLSLIGWLQDKTNKQKVLEWLDKYGAVLFRGFKVPTVEIFKEVSSAISSKLFDYADPSSPRTLVSDKVYTSTDYSSTESIRMHNELSYSQRWPTKLFFYCKTPAETQGETPIAASKNVLAYLGSTADKFMKKGLMYVRNLRPCLGLSWQHVYGTDDKAAVEAYLKQYDINFEWRSDDHLFLSWKRPAIIKHPVSGNEVWFNHAYFFHESNYSNDFRRLAGSGLELPFNSYYGDGEPIEDETIRKIENGLTLNTVVFQWQHADILVLDNLSVSHGRSPFTGKREIAVAMGD